MTEAERDGIISIVDNELGNIEVDERGHCKWTDVANALTHIQAQLRSVPTADPSTLREKTRG